MIVVIFIRTKIVRKSKSLNTNIQAFKYLINGTAIASKFYFSIKNQIIICILAPEKTQNCLALQVWHNTFTTIFSLIFYLKNQDQ